MNPQPQSQMTPPMPNPDLQQPQMPEHTEYDKIFDRSFTAIGSSFYLKGRENRGKAWELKNKLELAYEKKAGLPRLDKISFYDYLK
jgi:hypothetical protein